jgi:hypothetical protein
MFYFYWGKIREFGIDIVIDKYFMPNSILFYQQMGDLKGLHRWIFLTVLNISHLCKKS